MLSIRDLLRSYFKGAVFLSLPQLVGIILNLVTLPVILRILPPEEYGLYAFVLALQVWLTAFTAGQITMGAKKGIAEGKEGTFLFAFFRRLRFFSVAVLGGLALTLYFSTIHEDKTLGWLMGIITAYLALGYLPQVSYPEYQVAKKNFSSFFVWQMFLNVLSPLGALLAVFIVPSVVAYTLTQFFLITLVSLIGFFFIVRKYHLWESFRRKEIDKECYKYGTRLVPSEILLITSSQLSNFIIGPFFGFANLAIFSIATRMDTAFRGFLRLSYHLLYADFAREDLDSLRSLLRVRLTRIFMYSAVVSVGCYLVGSFYIHFFLPGIYQSSYLYLAILVLGLPAFMTQSVLRTALEATLRHREINALITSSSILRIIAILVFGYFFQIVGVVLAMTLITWFELLVTYRLLMK